ncbi:hypothetical protein SLS60_001758 [Paraconiothyrium brasiliense]|uniref:Uncharacterized protein n=1 Tax=Paraconiothyrium brasiliense TaxID=300254 RepID=A0ABR3S0U8_9PLEO
MAYSTVIHIPKPPPLRRRNHLDADTLEEMLRAADRARAKPYVDVDMEDCDAGSQSQDTDDMSFRTSASSFPSSSASSYPSPPSSPSPAPLYFPPPPKQSEVPILDLDEMDWDWGDAYDGNVIYGAAGVALSPRVMKERKREANVCCRCRYSMDEEDNGLFVIDEESEEESEEEGAFRV